MVIAEAPRADLIYIEQHWYFPLASVRMEYLQPSDTPYTCPWKGVCRYYHVGDAAEPGQWSRDNAWSYPAPLESAVSRVKKDFTGYVAFWRDVQIIE